MFWPYKLLDELTVFQMVMAILGLLALMGVAKWRGCHSGKAVCLVIVVSFIATTVILEAATLPTTFAAWLPWVKAVLPIVAAAIATIDLFIAIAKRRFVQVTIYLTVIPLALYVAAAIVARALTLGASTPPPLFMWVLDWRSVYLGWATIAFWAMIVVMAITFVVWFVRRIIAWRRAKKAAKVAAKKKAAAAAAAPTSPAP